MSRSTSPTSRPTASKRIETAIEEAAAATSEGHPQVALETLTAASNLLGSGPVRRALRVSLHRDRGLAQLSLDDADGARQSLLLALEKATDEGSLADPVRGALVALELMLDRPQRAQRLLADRGRDRSSTLLSLARARLYDGDLSGSEQALQAAEQAPGGTIGVHPPSSALRSIAAIWDGRSDQARMLYDGVGNPAAPYWQLVRLALLRSLWVQSGDGRYLQLAMGTAEQIRFGNEVGPLVGLKCIAAGQHAAMLAAAGELRMAVDAADSALESMPKLMVPEWPRRALLTDLAMVYRDAGRVDRHREICERAETLPEGDWARRMVIVAGPRAHGALTVATAQDHEALAGVGGDRLLFAALELAGEPRDPWASLLTATCERVGAVGGIWKSSDRKNRARVGADQLALGELGSEELSDHRIALSDGSILVLHGARPRLLSGLNVKTLDRLAGAADAIIQRRAGRMNLESQLELAGAGRSQAELALESARRPGTAAVLGGRFPSVIGRSAALAEVLDRLTALWLTPLPIILEGPAGSGRRHLARAAADPAICHAIDAATVVAQGQSVAVERLLSTKNASVIIANAEHLEPIAAQRVVDALNDATGPRVILTMDDQAVGGTAKLLRTVASAGRVKVPGLDERLEDLPLLIDAFAQQLGKRPEDVGTAARALLARRFWPGHLAELKATLQHAAVRAGQQRLLPEHLDAALPEATTHLSESLGLGYHDAVRDFRRSLLKHALAVTADNRTRAAALLGLQRTYFMRLIRDLGATEAATTPTQTK